MMSTKRIRASQYEHTVNGIVYEIHEVERSEGFARPRWNIRRKGGGWFEAASTLREAKVWAENDATSGEA